MTYFLHTKRHILMRNSDYNLKKHKSCKQKSKILQHNMNKLIELKRKCQIKKSKKISYWSPLQPITLNKTASEASPED